MTLLQLAQQAVEYHEPFPWLQYGTGAALALWSLEKGIILFAKFRNGGGKKSNSSSGDFLPLHWERRFDQLGTIIERQTDILKSVAEGNAQMQRDVVALLERTTRGQ